MCDVREYYCKWFLIKTYDSLSAKVEMVVDVVVDLNDMCQWAMHTQKHGCISLCCININPIFPSHFITIYSYFYRLKRIYIFPFQTKNYLCQSNLALKLFSVFASFTVCGRLFQRGTVAFRRLCLLVSCERIHIHFSH